MILIHDQTRHPVPDAPSTSALDWLSSINATLNLDLTAIQKIDLARCLTVVVETERRSILERVMTALTQ